jgi:hypothetical protein
MKAWAVLLCLHLNFPSYEVKIKSQHLLVVYNMTGTISSISQVLTHLFPQHRYKAGTTDSYSHYTNEVECIRLESLTLATGRA